MSLRENRRMNLLGIILLLAGAGFLVLGCRGASSEWDGDGRAHAHYADRNAATRGRDSLMAGVTAKLDIINGRKTMFPVHLIFKIRASGSAVETDIVEIGLRAEGIKEAPRKRNIPFANFPMRKMNVKIIKTVLGFKNLPSHSPFTSVYIKVDGQETALGDITSEASENIIKALNEPLEQHVTLKKLISKPLNGIVGRDSRALLNTEIRHIIPSSVGLPAEISLYSTAVTNTPVNDDMKVTPTPSSDFSISQLLRSLLQLNTNMSPSILLHRVGTMGINTPLMQSGMEFHRKVHTNIPAKLNAPLDMKEKNLRNEFTPLQQEDHLVQTRNGNAESGTQKNAGERSSFQRAARAASSNHDHMEKEASSETRSKKSDNLAAGQHHQGPLNDTFTFCIKIPRIPLRICLQQESKNAASKKQSFFDQAVRHHEAELSVKPHHGEAPVENIQKEVTAGTKSASKIMAQAVDNTEAEELDESAIPENLKRILGIGEEFTARNENLRQNRDEATINTDITKRTSSIHEDQ